MDIQNFYDTDYKDRGMKKWGGFILSEHDLLNQKTQQSLAKRNPQKEQMSPEAIGSILEEALRKNKAVIIQLEMLDENNQYFDDVVGYIKGHDELGIFVDKQKVGYDEIRHIQSYSPLKWTVTEKQT